MRDSSDAELPGLSDPIGLCATCQHVREVNNLRGSIFYLCQRSEADSRFPRYPRLPVMRCAGYEKSTESEDA